jgi:hypothetical protein
VAFSGTRIGSESAIASRIERRIHQAA